MFNWYRSETGIAFLTITAAIVILGQGCCGPPVKQTLGEKGDISNVKHWQIRWDNQQGEQGELIELAGDPDQESKYTLADNCRQYIEDIKLRLIRNYDYSFAENYPLPGLISVRLKGRRGYLEQPREKAPQAEEIERDLNQPSHDPRFEDTDSLEVDLALLGSGSILRSGFDHVTTVEVRVFDSEGELAGTIIVGGRSDDNVRPKHVAGAIHKFLSEIIQ